jgi:hypothetical protein
VLAAAVVLRDDLDVIIALNLWFPASWSLVWPFPPGMGECG